MHTVAQDDAALGLASMDSYFSGLRGHGVCSWFCFEISMRLDDWIHIWLSTDWMVSVMHEIHELLSHWFVITSSDAKVAPNTPRMMSLEVV